MFCETATFCNVSANFEAKEYHHVAFGAPYKETSWVIVVRVPFLETMDILCDKVDFRKQFLK